MDIKCSVYILTDIICLNKERIYIYIYKDNDIVQILSYIDNVRYIRTCIIADIFQ